MNFLGNGANIFGSFDNGEVIAARHNERELTGDPTAHAEVLALRDAAGEVGGVELVLPGRVVVGDEERASTDRRQEEGVPL